MLLSFAALAIAQPTEAEMRKARGQAKMMPYMMPMLVKTLGEGRTTGMMFIEDGDDPEFQKLTDTTSEQFAEFYNFMMAYKDETKPKVVALLESVADETDPARIAETGAEFEAIYDTIFADVETKLNEIVTPEQMMKLRQMEMQVMQPAVDAGVPFINYESYTGLDLSDAQKKQLDEIRQSFQKEQMDFFSEMAKLQPKPGQPPKPEELQKLRKRMEEIGESGKKLNARIRAKLLTILNKDQTAKLESLLTNIPEFVKKKHQARTQAPKPVDEKELDKWKESWKPGQPIPEKFRQEEISRRRVFPTAG